MSEPEAAVALLHAVDADSALLIRRTEREGDSWSGQWSLPGGRRDPGDVDLLHTALRELEEECGISLPRSALERAMPSRLVGRRVGRYFLVAPFVFRVASEFAMILDPLEAAHAEWLPLEILRDLAASPPQRPRPSAGDPVPGDRPRRRASLGLHLPAALRLARPPGSLRRGRRVAALSPRSRPVARTRLAVRYCRGPRRDPGRRREGPLLRTRSAGARLQPPRVAPRRHPPPRRDIRRESHQVRGINAYSDRSVIPGSTLAARAAGT